MVAVSVSSVCHRNFGNVLHCDQTTATRRFGFRSSKSSRRIVGHDRRDRVVGKHPVEMEVVLERGAYPYAPQPYRVKVRGEDARARETTNPVCPFIYHWRGTCRTHLPRVNDVVPPPRRAPHGALFEVLRKRADLDHHVSPMAFPRG